MNDREKWRERVEISVLAARHDDDDDDILYIIYIYVCVCVWLCNNKKMMQMKKILQEKVLFAATV